MERLVRTVDEAIRTNDFYTLSTVFSPHGGWQALGGGEQRTLAAHFVKSIVATTATTTTTTTTTTQQPSTTTTTPPTSTSASSSTTTFLPGAFESSEGMNAISQALSHLPATPVENGADNTLRQLVFDYKVSGDGVDNDYVGAARILGGLRIEDNDINSVYFMKPHEKCDVYVKIAECFLEEDETVEADSAVTKAGGVVEDITNPEEHRTLILRYKSTYARVLDANRKFLQASSRYHDLSQAHDDVDAESLLIMLGRAATCAILAQIGPQRQRILGLVFKDQRLSQLDTIPDYHTHSSVIHKMYMMQILKQSEMTQFENSLQEHQRAIMGDGLTIVERSVMEHNILAVGKLYYNIYFTELGRILGCIDRVKAEKVAAGMILDGRLKGSIDQTLGLLTFDGGAGAGAGAGAGGADTNASALLGWDESITSMCIQLNKLTEVVREVVDGGTAA